MKLRGRKLQTASGQVRSIYDWFTQATKSQADSKHKGPYILLNSVSGGLSDGVVSLTKVESEKEEREVNHLPPSRIFFD